MDSLRWGVGADENSLEFYITSNNRTKEQFDKALALALCFPRCSTGLCAKYKDIGVYKEICESMDKNNSHNWFGESYGLLHYYKDPDGSNTKMLFLRVLLSYEKAREVVRLTNSGVDREIFRIGRMRLDTVNWCERFFKEDHLEDGLQGELDLIEDLDQSPLVKSVVTGFLFPNL